MKEFSFKANYLRYTITLILSDKFGENKSYKYIVCFFLERVRANNGRDGLIFPQSFANYVFKCFSLSVFASTVLMDSGQLCYGLN